MSAAFRPIAPAMPDVYSAQCNPPRRAKRLRSDSAPTLPPLDHTLSSSSFSQPDIDDDDEDEDDEDDHHPNLPPPKRRGRRPGTLSRAAREAQRKINHSLIEKARRTKINDALATLRELVPPDSKRPSDPVDDDNDDDGDDLEPKKPKPKPKAAGEKEFKLEILVRTVAYLQDLTDKVKQLEQRGCPRCREPISLSEDSPSRKRRPDDSRDSSVAPSRLPSISAWLPSSADEQRALLRTPSQSPACDTIVSMRSGQLPTPPTSAVCAPATAGFQVPPVLTLPSPSTFLPPTTHMQPRFFGFTSRAHPKASPVSSPVYTPEDETAASLLLRMSATSPRAVSVRPVETDPKLAGYALTPSRLLGLSSER